MKEELGLSTCVNTFRNISTINQILTNAFKCAKNGK